MICGSPTEYYFSKVYSEAPFDEFMRDVGPVRYHKCTYCGFVGSQTHAEMEPDRWAKLNSDCHHFFENPINERKGNQPPYLEQAVMLLLLSKNGIIDIEDAIDYAAGYGTLSRLLEKYMQTSLKIYDPFIQDGDPSRYVRAADLRTYRVVINSAMFEHVLRREDLDQVNALVAEDGCLVVHTVVGDAVPKDPNWFYLRPPVHTAFHTNKSMSILMEQWGYQSSIYSAKSKCWVLLKRKISSVAGCLAAMNTELQSEWFHYRDGFTDYWKN
jgi:hypothetical protein